MTKNRDSKTLSSSSPNHLKEVIGLIAVSDASIVIESESEFRVSAASVMDAGSRDAQIDGLPNVKILNQQSTQDMRHR